MTSTRKKPVRVTKEIIALKEAARTAWVDEFYGESRAQWERRRFDRYYVARRDAERAAAMERRRNVKKSAKQKTRQTPPNPAPKETLPEQFHDTEYMAWRFNMSQPAVRRLVKKAKAGKSRFPLPVPMGLKGHYRWNPETVRQFENATDTTQPPPALDFESEKSCRKRDVEMQKRHAEATKNLVERFGIKIPQKEQD